MLEPAAQIKSRHDELSMTTNLFNDPSAQALREAPLQQLWREHLLSRAMVDGGLYGQGRFVVIHPAQNINCSNAVQAYRHHLVSSAPEETGFDVYTLEKCISTFAEIGDPKMAETLKARYLDFDRLDQTIFGE